MSEALVPAPSAVRVEIERLRRGPRSRCPR